MRHGRQTCVDDILAVLLNEHGADDLVDILTVDAVSAALFHRVHEGVGNGVDHEDFLLGHAQDIIVEARAVDDVLGSLRDIGGLVDDDRGDCPGLRQRTSCRTSWPRRQRPRRR